MGVIAWAKRAVCGLGILGYCCKLCVCVCQCARVGEAEGEGRGVCLCDCVGGCGCDCVGEERSVWVGQS